MNSCILKYEVLSVDSHHLSAALVRDCHSQSLIAISPCPRHLTELHQLPTCMSSLTTSINLLFGPPLLLFGSSVLSMLISHFSLCTLPNHLTPSFLTSFILSCLPCPLNIRIPKSSIVLKKQIWLTYSCFNYETSCCLCHCFN